MALSLLAHLYSRIRGSQEDVATLSLQYLLSQSAELNRAFTQQAETALHCTIGKELQYSCQVVGEGNERPDMAGVDNTGKEILLCEMKFYAGLTANQPTSYLQRVHENNGGGLLFVCPKVRVTSLWTKLLSLCPEGLTKRIGQNCVSVDGVHMAILSWAEVIENLKRVAVSVAPGCLSDIQQLEGFCAQMDSDAFIPFSSDDLSTETAIKLERYYAVVDETATLLCADKAFKFSQKGKSNPYRDGYERKLECGGISIRIAFDRSLWKSNSSMDTPFWLAVGDHEYQITEPFKRVSLAIPEIKKEDSVWSLVYFGLEAPSDATLDEVCNALKNQILLYVEPYMNG